MANINFLAGWTEEVSKYIKGIDNSVYTDLLEDEIRDTLRDFCRRSGLWTFTLPRSASVG